MDVQSAKEDRMYCRKSENEVEEQAAFVPHVEQ